MRMILGKRADTIRTRFTDAFADKQNEYYKTAVREKRLFSDGLCYIGYLWDCMKNREIVSERAALERASQAEKTLVMWDLNSKDMIPVPNYWKYPKTAVLELSGSEIESILPTLPEDVYFFDESFTWAVALTHEYSDKGRRYCVSSKTE